MNGEHKLAVLVWGFYSILVGSLAIWTHQFSQWVSFTILTAAVGNSAHLISIALGNYFTAKASKASGQVANQKL